MEYYSATRKDEILIFAIPFMDRENVMLSEISLSEKAKNRMISFICGMKNWNSYTQRTYGGYQWEGDGEGSKWKENQNLYMVMEDDLTLVGEHTMQYKLETYMILLTDVSPINLTKKELINEVNYIVLLK